MPVKGKLFMQRREKAQVLNSWRHGIQYRTKVINRMRPQIIMILGFLLVIPVFLNAQVIGNNHRMKIENWLIYNKKQGSWSAIKKW